MLVTPESSGTIPEKEAKALENVRTEILIGEQKIKQLQVAERQLKGEIQADLQDKARAVSAIESLTEQKNQLASEIDKNEQELSSLREDVAQAQDVFVKTSKATSDKEQSLNSRESSIVTREKNLDINEQNHKKNVTQLALDKKQHEERVTKLLNALK